MLDADQYNEINKLSDDVDYQWRHECGKRTESRGTIMPMSAVVAGTPYYVLMDGNRRVGPKVAQLHSGIECSGLRSCRRL